MRLMRLTCTRACLSTGNDSRPRDPQPAFRAHRRCSARRRGRKTWVRTLTPPSWKASLTPATWKPEPGRTTPNTRQPAPDKALETINLNSKGQRARQRDTEDQNRHRAAAGSVN